jgi:hypothetical protein
MRSEPFKRYMSKPVPYIGLDRTSILYIAAIGFIPGIAFGAFVVYLMRYLVGC